MTANESLALFISFIVVICLTIDSVLLVRDINLPTKDEEPCQGWIAARLITLLVMWGVWGLFTISYIPWGTPNKDGMTEISQTIEGNQHHGN